MLLKKILDILDEKDNNGYRSCSDPWIKIKKLSSKENSYEISYGAMYSSPAGNLSLARLIKLSELFGTTSIDVDEFANSGCESCDYWSSYGHDIQIYEIKINLEEIEKLTTMCKEEKNQRFEDLEKIIKLEMGKV